MRAGVIKRRSHRPQPDLTTLARGSLTVRRMPKVVVPELESEDDFPDLSRR
jgi:hypothetical protein